MRIVSAAAITGIVLSATALTMHPSSTRAALVDESRISHVLIASPVRIEDWNQFLADRNTLVRKTLHLRLPQRLQHLHPEGWDFPLIEYAHWIILKQENGRAYASLDEYAIKRFLQSNVEGLLPAPSDVIIRTLPTEDNPRAEREGFARDGWVLQPDAPRQIIRSVNRGILDVTIGIEHVSGTVQAEDGSVGRLRLLSRGHSNFRGSVYGRVANIEKALSEHIDGVLLQPGETLDFNSLLGETVSLNNGWKLSLGIFNNGEELRDTPGGGICQTSTTTYRALVQAGLPIVEKSNHSMYISYYTAFGEGLDAAIYLGGKNLKAENDTSGHLYLQAYTEGNDAYVEVYGVPDRSVYLAGPYRRHDAPDDLSLPNDRRMGSTEIAWKQSITYFDTREPKEDVLISRYTTPIPWSPSKNSGELPVQGIARQLEPTVFASAPEPTTETEDPLPGEGA